jgi:hypothetical protein
MNNSGGNCGIGFFGVLAIVFIVLKLLGVVTFSWLWVLAPIWIPFVIWLVIVAIVTIVTIIKIK